MPLVNNSDGTRWYTTELGEMLARPEARSEAIAQLVAHVVGARRPGLVVDFEEVPEERQREFSAFVRELAAGLHRSGLQLMVALPAADPAYDYRTIGREADAVVLMNYDQHWLTSGPGPIAAQDWFVRNLEATLALVPREKLVLAVAGYAYDWTLPKAGEDAPPRARALSFQESLVTALESEASVELDPDSLNPHFAYGDESGRDPPGLVERRDHGLQPDRAPATAPACAARSCGGSAPRTRRSGRSGAATARLSTTSPGSRRCRRATTSCSRATATSGGSSRRRRPGRARSAATPRTA